MPRRTAFHATPMTWIVLGVVVLHTVGIGWGLPGSDGWDNDGVAPRDFLPGLAETFTPGHFYTYPPVHLALLAVLTLPVTLVGALRAPSFALQDVVSELLAPGYMTTIAYIARFVSMLMSVGIVLFAARIVEELRAFELGEKPRASRIVEGDFDDPRVRRLGWCTAAFMAVEASLTYYGHTTNLDVPYLFWGMAALLAFVRAIARDEPRRFRHAFALAVVAISTKDQAYALFGLSFPVTLVLARPRIKDLAIAAALAVALLLVTDAVLFNPTGFRARVAFLTGPASQDFVEYTRDWRGRFGLLRDAAGLFFMQFPALAVPVIMLGLYRALAGARGRRLAIALLPLLVATSFTVLFNWTALRSNARFLLPQAMMLGLYGGIGAESLLYAERRGLRVASVVMLSVPFVLGLYRCVAVDAAFLFDPRYDCERWMREHIAPGDTVETYGLNVYLPRFPEGRRVIRVGPEPLDKRNPMPGITEVQDAYENAPRRGARYIVLSEAWAWRYLISPSPSLATGQTIAPNQWRTASEEAPARFFFHLVRSEGDFGLVHVSDYEHRAWFPIIDVHGAVGRSVWIYERKVP
jgi:hypothetical protein